MFFPEALSWCRQPEARVRATMSEPPLGGGRQTPGINRQILQDQKPRRSWESVIAKLLRTSDFFRFKYFVHQKVKVPLLRALVALFLIMLLAHGI